MTSFSDLDPLPTFKYPLHMLVREKVHSGYNDPLEKCPYKRYKNT